ncbi:ABC transporter permease [Oceanirhabdus sp. W0125-5]|uniref:ABC transporter permease n=1 Tax=Oceanirhabdus sp. W0125-5 TaxID=2999116 RepID=UPI0022F30FF4|nr:ABC transporter permease [Oceanirhabdus sp. W0125-5]WBW97797.1 ABC transporter permease [Oceanirhabdus sp. W0125-5]
MLDFIYCEILKFKRTGFLISGILFSLIWLPLALFNTELTGEGAWYLMFYKFEYITFGFLYTIIITILVSLIFTREVRQDTANVAFCYPSGRTGVIINKLLAGAIIIGIIYCVSFIMNIIGGMIFIKQPVNVAAILNHGKVFLVSYLLQISIMPLAALIAMLFGNIVFSFSYAMILMVANFAYAFNDTYRSVTFGILPVIINLNTPSSMVDKPINILISNQSITLGVCVFIIGLLGCFIYGRKASIN